MKWRIYYQDVVVSGASKQEWIKAPDDGVQVVVAMQPPSRPYPDRSKTGFVFCGRNDRTFYTGVDRFDPFGYGHMKAGSLLSDKDYAQTWGRAYGDD